jgi:alkanesulfonate monooxygenase SsuD/methylene tetrahydromethanopterin reductase-like flavin-dependent oxidoreductase (luciferase family)
MKIDLAVSSIDISPTELVDVARVAEEVGYDGVWTYDHVSGVVLRGTRSLDVWSALGAVACSTSTVTIGPLVANTTTWHAAQIANAVATLDGLSAGRVMLGLGAGAGPGDPFSREMTMVGRQALGARERREIVADTVRFLRALWAGDRDVEGRYARLDDAQGIACPEVVPPIIVGANGPRMATLAGSFADGVNLHSWEADLEGLADVARDAARAAGNDHFTVTVEAPIGDSWLDPGSSQRTLLDRIGVDRLVLAWNTALRVERITVRPPHS